jgi:UDP-N-acetylmuramoyl-L-alanyl-D-glutamate--2,6-diaminopimelate ligase
MLLKELIDNIPIKQIIGNTDIEIDNISFDTRTTKKGSIFVCIKGLNSDRHTYYQKAIEKGAVAIVSEYPLETGAISNIVVENTNKALALLSSNFYYNPDKKLRIVGVTGTNGKTTTTNLIKTCLEQCGYKVGLIGTNEIVIDEEILPASCTTPEAPELFSYFAKMVEVGCDFAVMEVSSHSIALNRVYGINFKVGIFTNLTQDHLDFHSNMQEYAKTKAELFANCDISIINKDSDYFDIMKSKAKNLFTYGIHKECDYRAVDVEHRDNGVSYTVTGKFDSYRINFPIPGNFSVYNSLSVCALCSQLSIPDGFVRMALKNVKTIKGRCEIVDIDKSYKVIIDYAHTPDGMLNIISAINEFKKARLITVFGCGGDRDRGKRPQMGKIAKELSDIVVVTSDNPRSEDMQAIVDDILVGITDQNNVYVELDRLEAIKLAMQMAKENDIILLLGKGHELTQKFKDYSIHFDEREVVKSLCD